jgi:hypothetical protein
MALARMVMRDPGRLKAPAYRLLAYGGAAGCILTLAGLVTNGLWRPFRLFAVLNVIAAALYLLVEHPYNRMLRQWLASLEEAIAPAAGRSRDSAAPAVRNAAKQAAARR